MKNSISAFIILIILITKCYGQYDKNGIVINGGINFSNYLGQGEGNNYFKNETPGFQLEFAAISGDGFELIIWGVSYYKGYNYAENNKLPVTFWTPYYTEFSFHQRNKKNPLFCFLGYDYVRMKFPNMEKPDSQHNITFGGGWNLKLTNQLFLQFKLKPYFIIDNSIGQWFGINSMVNLHFGIPQKTD